MIKILAFSITLVTLLSCNQKQSNMTPTQHEKIVTQYFTHFNNHAWSKLAAMYADTVECKDPTLGQGIVKQTGKQLADKYEALQGHFTNLKDEVIQLYPSGDKHVIVEFISSGSAADGSSFTLPICTILKIENGLITKDFTYYDNFEEEKEGK